MARQSSIAAARREQRAQDRVRERTSNLTAQEIQQRKDRIEQRHEKPLCRSTQKAHDKVLEEFKRFLTEEHPTSVEGHLRTEPYSSATLPTAAQYKGFAYWLACRATGTTRDLLAQMDSGQRDTLKVLTLQHKMCTLFSALRRLTGCDGVTPQVRTDVSAYISGELAATLQLRTEARDKPVATSIDLGAVLEAAWAPDQKVFRLAEDRLAFTTSLKLLAYTASRPGEFVSAGANKPDGIRWKDIEFTRQVFRDENGKLASSLSVKVTVRALKGKVEDKSASKSNILVRDLANPLLCPVLDLVIIAGMQGILIGSVSNVLNAKVDHLKPGSYIVPLKKSGLAKFVLRKAVNKAGHLSMTKEAMSYDQHSRRLELLGQAANIDVRATSYAFRRLAANAVNRPDITAEDRRLLMGHNTNSRAFRAYIARTTQVDVQGLVTSGTEDRMAIQRAMQLSHGYKLPRACSVRGRQAVYALPEIRALTLQIAEARKNFEAKHPGLGLRKAEALRNPEALHHRDLVIEQFNRTKGLLQCTFVREVKQFVRENDAAALGISLDEDEQEEFLTKEFENTTDAQILADDTMQGFEALQSVQHLDLDNLEETLCVLEDPEELEETRSAMFDSIQAGPSRPPGTEPSRSSGA